MRAWMILMTGLAGLFAQVVVAQSPSGLPPGLPDLSGRAPQSTDTVVPPVTPYLPDPADDPLTGYDPDTGELVVSTFRTEEGWVFELHTDPRVPTAMRAAVEQGLRDATRVFSTLGFGGAPASVTVHIPFEPTMLVLTPGDGFASTRPENPHYIPAATMITLPVESDATAAAIKATAAHELFHAMQNARANALRMAARLWFIEATAEYVTYYHVYPEQKARMVSSMTKGWFSEPLASAEDTTAYQSSHFIHYLLTRMNIPLIALFNALVEDSASPMIETLTYPWVNAARKNALATRALTLVPLEAFVTRHSAGADLTALMRDFVAFSLFDPAAPAQIALDADQEFLRTKIGAAQVVQVFVPYDGAARRDVVVVQPDYAVAVWALDIDRKDLPVTRKIQIGFGGPLPDKVEVAVYVLPADKRMSDARPVQAVRRGGQLGPVTLEPGQDLFVVVVNGSDQPLTLPLEAEVLRGAEARRVSLPGGGNLALPHWMREEAPEHGAVWQARAGDVKFFETVSLFRRAAAAAETPRSICADYVTRRIADVSLGDPLGPGREVTVSGQDGWMLVQQGRWARQVPRLIYFYDGPKSLRLEKGEFGPDVDLGITLLCVRQGDDVTVLRAVASAADAGSALWPERVLSSLTLPEAGEVADDVLKTFSGSGEGDGLLFETRFAGCVRGSFDARALSPFMVSFRTGEIGARSNAEFRIDRIVMLANWQSEPSGRFTAQLSRFIGPDARDRQTAVSVVKGACLSAQPDICEAIVTGPIVLKEGLHAINAPWSNRSALTCLGGFLGQGQPIRVYGQRLPPRAPDGPKEKLFDNWNPEGCGLTSVSQFSLSGETLLTALDTWVHWPDVQGGALRTRLVGPGLTDAGHALTFEKGECHPNLPDWCYGRAKPGFLLAPGSYRVIAEQEAICSNSASGQTGFMKGFGMQAHTD